MKQEWEQYKGIGTDVPLEVLYDMVPEMGLRGTSRFVNIAYATLQDKMKRYCSETGKPWPKKARTRTERGVNYRDLPEEEQEIESRKALYEEIKALRKRTDRQDMYFRNLKDILRTTILALPPVKPLVKYKPRKTRHDQIAMIEIGDWHFGELVRPEETSSIGGFNKYILRDRIALLDATIESIIQKQRNTYPTAVCYINILGDMVTGELVFASQLSQIDQNLVEQYALGQRQLALFIQAQARRFERVHVRAIPGNHPEGRKGKELQHALTEQEITFLFGVKQYLADQPNITFKVSRPGFMGYYITDSGNPKDLTKQEKANTTLKDDAHLLFHGDTVRSYLGLPYYGIDRLIGEVCKILNLVPSYVHLAHFHTGAQFPSGYIEALLNGSMVGPTQYSLSLRRASRAMQWLMFVHPEHGLTSRYPIWLSHKPEFTADKDGIFTPVWDFEEEAKELALAES